MEDLQRFTASAWADGCDEGPAARLGLLARGLAAVPELTRMRIGVTADSARLERLLRSGRLNDAVALGQTALGKREPARVLAFYGQVVLPLIRRLEADWAVERIGFDELGMVFFYLHRLLDQLAGPESGRRSLAYAPDQMPGSVLVATVPGEGHGFGAQIVADLVRAAGHGVLLGLDTTVEGLRGAVAERPLVAVFLSVGHDAALAGLADLIADLRAAADFPRMRIILGGPALVAPASQYHFLGADQVALTVQEALRLLPAINGPDGPAGRT